MNSGVPAGSPRAAVRRRAASAVHIAARPNAGSSPVPHRRRAGGPRECVTRLADRPDAVPDDSWAEAAAHYDEAALASPVVDIAAINAWNRLNAATRQVAGAWAG